METPSRADYDNLISLVLGLLKMVSAPFHLFPWSASRLAFCVQLLDQNTCLRSALRDT